MPKLYASKIISTPNTDKSDASGYVEDYHFGFFETINARPTQEDSLSWQILNSLDLTPLKSSKQLAPKAIGHRLWTTYQIIDRLVEEQKLMGGTTASTTIYDGKGNLITATLGDAAAFIAAYDTKDNLIGVIRLNSTTHKPTDPTEEARIKSCGGRVEDERVNAVLAVSRAIGDYHHDLKINGVCSEATINIISFTEIAEQLNIPFEDLERIRLITSCDGFTDGAVGDTKIAHEHYLSEILKTTDAKEAQNEENLSCVLLTAAIIAGSFDNISVAIQTITKQSPAFLLGVYDGHAGSEAAEFTAQNIGSIFIKQCKLDPSIYANQELSVDKKELIYKRDNLLLELDEEQDQQETEEQQRDSQDAEEFVAVQIFASLYAIESQTPKAPEKFPTQMVHAIKKFAQDKCNLLCSIVKSLTTKA